MSQENITRVVKFRLTLTENQQSLIDEKMRLLKYLWNLAVALQEEVNQRRLRDKFGFKEFSPEFWELSYLKLYSDFSHIEKLPKDKTKLLVGNPCCKIAYLKNKKDYTPIKLEERKKRPYLGNPDAKKHTAKPPDKKDLKKYFYPDLADKIFEIGSEFRGCFYRYVISKAFETAKKGIRGFPKYKGKLDSVESLIVGHPTLIKIRDGGIFLNKQIGLLVIDDINRLPKDSDVRMASIVRKASGYYLHLTVNLPVPMHFPSDRQIGIDVGCVNLYTDSEGRHIETKAYYRNKERKIAHLQRKMARQEKGSANYLKSKEKLALLHEQIKDRRAGYLHQVSHKLTQKYSHIAMEDLKLKNMTKRANVKENEDGTYAHNGASAKSGLNKSILDQGIGELKRQLLYKSQEKGGQVVLVNPKFTSQTCFECGHKHKDNRKSQSEFICVSCGHSANADENAAKNILTLSLISSTIGVLRSSLLSYPSLLGKAVSLLAYVCGSPKGTREAERERSDPPIDPPAKGGNCLDNFSTLTIKDPRHQSEKASQPIDSVQLTLF